MIDEYSRFPVMDIVKSTRAESVILKLDCTLRSYGIPEKIKCDNGPPSNSKAMEDYARKQGFHHGLITPEHPQSNGLVENFMKILIKVMHTAYTDAQDPRQTVHNFLLRRLRSDLLNPKFGSQKSALL